MFVDAGKGDSINDSKKVGCSCLSIQGKKTLNSRFVIIGCYDWRKLDSCNVNLN